MLRIVKQYESEGKNNIAEKLRKEFASRSLKFDLRKEKWLLRNSFKFAC